MKTMDLTQMTQLISNVGFPIACCCVMFYQNSKLQQTLQEITVTMQSLVTKVNEIEYNLKEKEGE